MLNKFLRWFYKDSISLMDFIAITLFGAIINVVGWASWYTLLSVVLLVVTSTLIEYVKKHLKETKII